MPPQTFFLGSVFLQERHSVFPSSGTQSFRRVPQTRWISTRDADEPPGLASARAGRQEGSLLQARHLGAAETAVAGAVAAGLAVVEARLSERVGHRTEGTVLGGREGAGLSGHPQGNGGEEGEGEQDPAGLSGHGGLLLSRAGRIGPHFQRCLKRSRRGQPLEHPAPASCYHLRPYDRRLRPR